jgi:hypothetical protein
VTVWLLTFKFIHFMTAFWAVFTFGGSGPAITAHGLLDLKQEIQIQMAGGSGVTVLLYRVKLEPEIMPPLATYVRCYIIVIVG